MGFLSLFSIVGFAFSCAQVIMIYRIYRVLERSVPKEERSDLFRLRVGNFVIGLVVTAGLTALTGNAAETNVSKVKPSTDAASKVRISVSSFTENSGTSRCGPWLWNSDWLGSEFRDQLTTELYKLGKFEILERKNLNTMYSEEHQLVNADPTFLPEKNKYKAAQYSVTGAVTAFELCESGLGGALDVGSLVGLPSLEVELRGQTAKAAINLRIVNVTTGEVVGSFMTDGEASSKKVGLSVEALKNLRMNSEGFQNSPLGLAAQEAIHKAAIEIGSRI